MDRLVTRILDRENERGPLNLEGVALLEAVALFVDRLGLEFRVGEAQVFGSYI